METLNLILSSLFLLVFMCGVIAPPPRKQPEPAHQPQEDPDMNAETLGLEYRNYLEEVVKVLEEDPQFKVILDNATEQEIKSGSVADRLHVVDPSIRSKLDELKRIELDRLRRKATEAFELSNGLDRDAIKEPLHLEHRNPHTFREEDLRRLVQKTAHDLEGLDRKRHEEFKKYEMEKEFNHAQELKKMDKQHREEAEKKHEEEKKEHKKHEKVHHPLSEDQLEEVWEDQDHMDKDSFSPETFFRMHDVDGNEQLDPVETMALFKTELDKLYNGSDADLREREEEMNQMRETTYQEVDKDKNGLISLEEFLDSAQHDDYKRDQGWEGIPDREHEFEQKEFDDFSHHREEELSDGDHHDQDEHHDEHKDEHHDEHKDEHHDEHKDEHHDDNKDGDGHQEEHHEPAAGHPQLQLPIGQQQQQVPVQQQKQQAPVQQQQQVPMQQQQIPIQQQQAPIQQQQHQFQQQQVPIQQQFQQQQVPIQQQQIPVPYQQQIRVQQQQQQVPIQQQQQFQQQPHGQINQIPVQTKL